MQEVCLFNNIDIFSMHNIIILLNNLLSFIFIILFLPKIGRNNEKTAVAINFLTNIKTSINQRQNIGIYIIIEFTSK